MLLAVVAIKMDCPMAVARLSRDFFQHRCHCIRPALCSAAGAAGAPASGGRFGGDWSGETSWVWYGADSVDLCRLDSLRNGRVSSKAGIVVKFEWPCSTMGVWESAPVHPMHIQSSEDPFRFSPEKWRMLDVETSCSRWAALRRRNWHSSCGSFSWAKPQHIGLGPSEVLKCSDDLVFSVLGAGETCRNCPR